MTAAFDVQRQIAAHHGHADHAYCLLTHLDLSLAMRYALKGGARRQACKVGPSGGVKKAFAYCRSVVLVAGDRGM